MRSCSSTDRLPASALLQVMPAKFVNLIEFFELKIFEEVEMVGFIERGIDRNVIILSVDMRNMGPDKKFAFG
jgi:hypothetical protein